MSITPETDRQACDGLRFTAKRLRERLPKVVADRDLAQKIIHMGAWTAEAAEQWQVADVACSILLRDVRGLYVGIRDVRPALADGLRHVSDLMHDVSAADVPGVAGDLLRVEKELDKPDPAERWAGPMLGSKIAEKFGLDWRTAKPKAERHGLKQGANRQQWFVRIDKMDAATRRRFDK